MLRTCPSGVVRSCSHSDDVGVRCQLRTGEDNAISATVSLMEKFIIGCRDGYLRLAGGRNSLEGRVEVCHDGVWGTVCNNHWGREEAAVACRQLGHADSGMYDS